MASSGNARAVAATCLASVFTQHRSLTEVLDQVAAHPNRALIKAMCYGVMRWYVLLDAYAKTLLNKPVKDDEVYALILLGLYQLKYMRIKPHAIVNETVDAVKVLNKPWASKLVNAVLRRFQRDDLTQVTARWHEAHPKWLLKAIQKDWPNDWQRIITANNSQAPLWLRINQRQTTVEQYLTQVSGSTHPELPQAIMLSQAMDAHELPGFEAGQVAIQDGSAQLAAKLLQLQPHLTILDACAAPGGKTCHLLECEPSITLTAIDKDKTRLQKIQENLTRLKLPTPNLIAADAIDTKTWWSGQLFDRILLDAPCSATGVIRRHPDIKYLRLKEDIPNIANTQRQLLNALWPLLKPGGFLLYATCSILKQENEQQIEDWLKEHEDAEPNIISISYGEKLKYGIQILPGDNDCDGFYYSLVQKNILDIRCPTT